MAILHLFRICVFKVRLSSRYAPKYLITFTLGISQSLTVRLCTVHFTSCCLDPKSINSVLVWFILSLFSSIQVLTCLSEFSKTCFVSDSLILSLPRKLFFKAWSSAYPCKSTLSGTHFFIVEAYTEYRVGPATLPCGTENSRFLADE